MKYLLLILILSVEIFSQATTPSGYTTNYGYRKWGQLANPSADSLNANWDELDADIKTAYDSASVKMNLYGNQDIQAQKNFLGILSIGKTGDRNAKLIIGNFGQSAVYAGELSSTAAGVYLTYLGNGVTPDTVAMLEDLRGGLTGYATLSGTQSFTGQKTFAEKLIPTDDVQYTEETIAVGDVSFSMDGATYGSLNPDDAWTVVTINGGANGKIVHLINSSATYSITLDDGGGNLQLAGDFVMSQYDAITLIYDSGISTWIELSRSNN
jgi:hypothetical protein